jgi:23S rRNA pseudouridine2605 synthase
MLVLILQGRLRALNLLYMRINKFIALATGLSRRAADAAVTEGRVKINERLARTGDQVEPTDVVVLDNRPITPDVKRVTIALNKPEGYICSREGQGSKTIYDLLPKELRHLKPVGRLDKNSSGLLLLTNDGELAHQLTHPSFQKEKVYEVELDKPLSSDDQRHIEAGIELEDGVSKLQLRGSGKKWQVTMAEGRNRQIRRTFAALEYGVVKLHRTKFGNYILSNLALGDCKTL